MSEFVIETQHLYKRFGQVTALEDINIQIRQGEFIAIMGASGSGKTTLMNILTGKKYHMIPKEIKDYVKGMYGKSPVPISEEMKKKIIGDQEVFTGRPADLLTNEYDEIKKEVGNLARNEEDVLTYAMFPQVAQTYFEKRNNPEKEIKVQTINVVF